MEDEKRLVKGQVIGFPMAQTKGYTSIDTDMDTVTGRPYIYSPPTVTNKPADSSETPQVCCTDRCCWVFCLILLVVASPFLGFLIYDNHYYGNNPAIQVDSFVLSLSPLNVSSTSLPTITDMNIVISVKNTNSYGFIRYEHIEVSVYYMKDLLIRKTIEPFKQLPKNHAVFKVFSSVLEKPFDESVSNRIAEDMKHGYVDFDVKLKGWITSKHMVNSDRQLMKVSCSELRVGFFSDKNISSWSILQGGSECSIHF